MRRALLVTLVVVVALSFVFPTLAAAPAKDDVKLRVFVHYPKQPGKPSPTGVCDRTSTNSDVYDVTGWKLPGNRTYRVNYGTIPASVTDAQNAIALSFAEWQTGSGIRFTEGDPTTVRGYKYDGQNVVVWGAVPSGAIAVTYTWYRDGIAVENDTVMGKGLPWAYTTAANPDTTCGNLKAYDVRDILTHEIGHWMGLKDIYTEADHDLTMYGYGSLGELKKDTLMSGDSAGLSAIYK